MKLRAIVTVRAILCALFVTGLAIADKSEKGGFWQRTADPGWEEYQRAFAEGMAALEEARRSRLTESIARDQAEAAFLRAVSASPARADGWLALGETLADAAGREEEAIDALHRARELGGVDYDAAGAIAFDLAVLHSKLLCFESALLEYQTATRSADDRRRSSALANSAEALMALGRTRDAIEYYRRAIEVMPADAAALTGAWWGLAVALDRDEQLARCKEAGEQALRLDPAIVYFNRPGVFFLPEGDVHYYWALAYELAGRKEAALEAWKRFQKENPKSPWDYRAQQHWDELKKASATGVATKHPRTRSQ